MARWDCGDGYKVTALPLKASCSSVFGLTTIEKNDGRFGKKATRPKEGLSNQNHLTPFTKRRARVGPSIKKAMT